MRPSSTRGTPTHHIDPSGESLDEPYTSRGRAPEEPVHTVSSNRYGVVRDTMGVDMNQPELE